MRCGGNNLPANDQNQRIFGQTYSTEQWQHAINSLLVALGQRGAQHFLGDVNWSAIDFADMIQHLGSPIQFSTGGQPTGRFNHVSVKKKTALVTNARPIVSRWEIRRSDSAREIRVRGELRFFSSISVRENVKALNGLQTHKKRSWRQRQWCNRHTVHTTHTSRYNERDRVSSYNS